MLTIERVISSLSKPVLGENHTATATTATKTTTTNNNSLSAGNNLLAPQFRRAKLSGKTKRSKAATTNEREIDYLRLQHSELAQQI